VWLSHPQDLQKERERERAQTAHQTKQTNARWQLSRAEISPFRAAVLQREREPRAKHEK